ncbi:hypothetical protein H0H81_003556 [Sphagnurus paluster]|uniref:Uncharacterized protein n=1 Tax=Sphagnurus paluster TaxID=117069 RepID=A0A9P7FV35_9AGAR|nr:hypothetical protein H0H81_003556 [Sphagnurus paluster]
MAAKTISSGTLGLRFMQNVQRAKQLKEVEAERAPVKDDGEWEIDPKIRDAWGTKSSSTSTSSEKPKGRRVFNKHGVEDVPQEKVPASSPTTTPPDNQNRPKVHHRPKISDKSGAGLFGFPDEPSSKSKTKSSKTAKQAIYDNTGVGEDLRRRATKTRDVDEALAADSLKLKSVFLKPAGVDEPTPAGSGPSSISHNSDPDVIQGARSKKAKRDRTNADQPDGEDAKPKKKKKKSS